MKEKEAGCDGERDRESFRARSNYRRRIHSHCAFTAPSEERRREIVIKMIMKNHLLTMCDYNSAWCRARDGATYDLSFHQMNFIVLLMSFIFIIERTVAKTISSFTQIGRVRWPAGHKKVRQRAVIPSPLKSISIMSGQVLSCKALSRKII